MRIKRYPVLLTKEQLELVYGSVQEILIRLDSGEGDAMDQLLAPEYEELEDMLNDIKSRYNELQEL